MSSAGVQVKRFDTAFFAENGYLIRKALITNAHVSLLRELTKCALDPVTGPVEFEAEVGYPGAPLSLDAQGGETPRRLLHAYSRNPAFAELATSALLGDQLRDIMDDDSLALSQNHHNCVMTKFPGFSSSTSWHQDIRYWSFDRPELVSVWCALSEETRRGGALAVIPGSHKLGIARGRLDRDLFLRADIEANRELLKRQVQIELSPGDVLFFHCRLFHAARKNLSDKVKLSAVFTYHAVDNLPIPGTRSDRYPAIPI